MFVKKLFKWPLAMLFPVFDAARVLTLSFQGMEQLAGEFGQVATSVACRSLVRSVRFSRLECRMACRPCNLFTNGFCCTGY